MKREPLFIRFANNLINEKQIIESFLAENKDEKSKVIAEETLTSPPDLFIFKRDFKNLLTDIIDNGINKEAINYIDSYMKPSLEEILDTKNGDYRYVILKTKEAPWVEAMLCYNLVLYIKAYGLKEIKQCPVCNKFFTTNGKYAKYCGDICKKQDGK